MYDRGFAPRGSGPGAVAADGEAGAFRGMSPPVPPVAFGDTSPAGTAAYEGDAAGLTAADGAVTKFLADVETVADFDGGTVGGFRTLGGEALGDLSVTLGETGFPGEGGTFGFAADDESLAVLGAFAAYACASTAGGNPGRPGGDVPVGGTRGGNSPPPPRPRREVPRAPAGREPARSGTPERGADLPRQDRAPSPPSGRMETHASRLSVMPGTQKRAAASRPPPPEEPGFLNPFSNC